MSMNFHHEYKLKKDTPTHKRGWPLRWCGSRGMFFFKKASTCSYNVGEPDIYLDYDGEPFTVEQVQDSKWFEPVGKAVPFIPPFPPERKIGEYATLLGETRLIEDVDECRAINELLNDKEFQHRLYEFYKKEYEQYHNLTPYQLTTKHYEQTNRTKRVL